MDRISSPEQLRDYMHVTNPSVWVVMVAIIVLLVSMLIWSAFAVIENQASGPASVQSGVLTLHFDNPDEEKNISSGMDITIGGITVPITYVGSDSGGNLIVGTDSALPDGSYPFVITYEITKVIKLLFN